MTNQDQSRADFEAWALDTCKRDPEELKKLPDGSYADAWIGNEWAAWQAALNHKAADVVLPEPVAWMSADGINVMSSPDHKVRDLYRPGSVRRYSEPLYTQHQLTQANNARAGLQALGCMLPEGYKSGIQTGAQVSLFFESQSNATAWFEAFMDLCEGAAPSVPQGWIPVDGELPEGEWLVYLPEERGKYQVANILPNVSTIGHVFDFDLTMPSHYAPLPRPPKDVINAE